MAFGSVDISSMRRLRWIPVFVLLACACWIAASANGASSAIVISMDVPSATTLTNNCTAASATRFGNVLPGTEATTATGAGAACSVTFGSSNDSSALRLGTRDGQSTAMSSPSLAWTTGRTNGTALLTVDRSTSGTVALAGGQYGLISRSIDGGSNWTDHWSGLASGDYVFDVEPVPGSDNAWVAVGGNGSVQSSTNVLSSSPANPTWTSWRTDLLASGWPASEHVEGVAVASASVWYVAGIGGHLAKTVDGGDNWVTWTKPGVSAYTDIDALSATTVYATGSNAALVSTTSGATTAAGWGVATNTCSCWFNDLSIGDATHVYLVSDGGAIVRWDGTAFASTTYANDQALYPLSIDASSSSPDTVFIGSVGGAVLRSTDSALTFARFFSNGGGFSMGVQASSALDAIAVGSSQNILRTTNGTSWILQSEDTGRRPMADLAVHPSDGQRAIAVGARGTVLRSSDSGSSWVAGASGSSANLRSVTWPESTSAVAVGSGGVILRSADMGATWSAVSSPTSQLLLDATSGDHEMVWAVGLDGAVVRSTNGGRAFSSVSAGTTETLDAVAAWGRQVAVVGGEGGTLQYTSNGGATWGAATGGVPSWDRVTGLAATSATTIWASGRYSGLWRSTNGGATFSAVTSPAGSDRIEALDATGDTIVAAANWGQVYLSRDDGATWSSGAANTGVDTNAVVDILVIDPHTFLWMDDLGGIRAQDEASAAASQVADYSGGSNFGSDDATGTFAVCLQSLAAATPAGTWAPDGGTCTAVDTDPWKAVPTAPQTVATTTTGATGTATFVWGLGPRLNQPPGVYRAGIVFEAIAPAA